MFTCKAVRAVSNTKHDALGVNHKIVGLTYQCHQISTFILGIENAQLCSQKLLKMSIEITFGTSSMKSCGDYAAFVCRVRGCGVCAVPGV